MPPFGVRINTTSADALATANTKLNNVRMGTNLAKASVLESFKAPLALREYPLPSRLEPGAALVRTEMAGICGTDVHLWKGELPISLPVILGHETVGRIEQMGEGLEKDWTGQALKGGDRVDRKSTR